MLTTAGLAVTWIELGVIAATAVITGLTAALAAAASVPAGRRFLAARAWCIVTPHRVRVGCAQAWIHSRNGKVPAVLLTRRQPFGERVYLWCRAGTSAEDLSSARRLLAAACWAADVHISRHPHYTHLVTVDVIRRWRSRSRPVPAGVSGAGDVGTSRIVLPLTEPADDGARTLEHHDDDLPIRRTTA